jgi:hypothetical protein
VKSRIVPFLMAVLFLCGTLVVLYAQSRGGGAQSDSGRIDLETRTWVGKRLDRTEVSPDGQKIYHYTYRVEARATARNLPRHIVDHRYSITHHHEGFRTGDSITLVSTNDESETDSPIWVYHVRYVGSGRRTISFATSGSVSAPMFTTVTGEAMDYCHCIGCQYLSCSTCLIGCPCVHCTHCICHGCQSQQPKCQFCPHGCTCSHCRCACSGCLSQSPQCTSCPPGCYCSHCGCLCVDDIDHFGVCGCTQCTSPSTRCRCECHTPCP